MPNEVPVTDTAVASHTNERSGFVEISSRRIRKGTAPSTVWFLTVSEGFGLWQRSDLLIDLVEAARSGSRLHARAVM